MRAVRVVLILAVALLMAYPVLAQRRKGEARFGPPGGAARVNRLLKGVDLTADQKAKIEEVNKTFDAKVADLMKQIRELETKRMDEVMKALTPDQQDQVKKNMEEFKKRMEEFKKKAAEERGK